MLVSFLFMLPMKDKAELKREEFSLPLELCSLAALTAVLQSTTDRR